MTTRWFQIDSPQDTARIEEAAAILRRGGLLAIPTETVYGLGADGLNEAAVAGIFEAKGRPQDNPLILHIPSVEWLTRYCEDVPASAYRLAEAFWPGPLTMILKKSALVPLRTTGGLDTVGVRCPDHAVTRAIIEAAGVPVAAPSANTSGRPSCTTAAHVREDMDGKIDGIVDGGDCRVGVESTIIDLTCTPPRLLRPGGLTLEALRGVLGEIVIDKALTQQLGAEEKPRAPGMKYRHYAPHAPVTVVSGAPRSSARWLCAEAPENAGLILFDEFTPLFPGKVVRTIGSMRDKAEQARRVFDALRSFDETPVQAIFAQCPDSEGLGLAVGNRLKKAAGFHIVDTDDAARVFFGITGLTGAGKTSVLRALKRLDGSVFIVDCDALYYELLASDTPLRRELRSVFPDAFEQSGAFNRTRMRELVFHDGAALSRLDDIVRAHVPREALRRARESGAAVVGFDAVKLLESGLGALCDRVVAVTAPEQARLRRIMARDGIAEEQARERIRAQRDEAFFRANCDVVFENAFSTPEETENAALELFKKLR
ncbi:MAG: threonylcarbamoyl-AMP synthase [Oscillospiraceae bacterium]|nr:threonylcarbamoyl-AMP synthase [Oscillospiraceae bacterium]